MAGIAAETLRSGISIGRVIDRGLRAVAANPLPIAALAFVFGTVPEMMLVYALHRSAIGAPTGLEIGSDAMMLLAVFLWVATSVVLGTLMQGSLARAVSTDALEGKVRPFELVTGALGHAPRLLALGGLMGLCVVATAPLVVPSLLLCLAWNVAGSVLAEEGRGPIAALRRSAELTRGVRWRVLGLTLVLFLFSAAAMTSTGLIGKTLFVDGNGIELAASGVWRPARLAFDAAAITVLRAVWGAVQAALYGELRASKEEGAPDQLAAIFA